MNPARREDRPVGVYMVFFYFVLTGFLESIQKYRDWGDTVNLNPLTERSIWHLATDISIYLAIAYLVWNLTWLGRLAALVFGYLYLATCLWFFILYLRGTLMNATPLFFILTVYHMLALPPLLFYLHRGKPKKLFRVNLLDILLPND
jgi:hypothetical protein